MSQEKPKIAVIGIGSIGAALCEILLPHSNLRVWNRSPEKSEPFVSKGAQGGTLDEVLESSSLIILVLKNYDITDDVLRGKEKFLKDKVIAQFSTGTVKEAKRFTEFVEHSGGHLIVGTLNSLPSDLGSEGALIEIAGPKESIDPYLDIFHKFGHVSYLGEKGDVVKVFDIATLSMYYGMMYGYLHGAAIVKKENVSLDLWLKRSHQMISGMILPSLEKINPKITTGDYNSTEANITLTLDNINDLIRYFEELGVDSSISRAHKNLLENVLQGNEEKDVNMVFEAMLHPSKG